jgi:hypothetical protein
MNRNCHVFANSCWEILPPLLLADNGYLGISQQLSDTLLAVLSGCPTALRVFPSEYQLKRGNFHPFSLKGHVSVIVY